MSGADILRKRMKRREVAGGLRFITFSCQRRLPLFSNPSIAWVFVRAMSAARTRWNFRLIAWVVMPEHVHMIVQPPKDQPLGPILTGIKTSVAKHVIARWKTMRAGVLARLDDGHGHPRFWQKGGGFDRNIRGTAELCREIRYTHRNPVERGLVDRPEVWRWSSVRWWMGLREQEIECDLPPGDEEVWKRWKEFL
ncbi:MAG: transposase [Phycisphaerales bacterium]|nr:transposase [Phycisphaerales bacterium]